MYSQRQNQEGNPTAILGNSLSGQEKPIRSEMELQCREGMHAQQH